MRIDKISEKSALKKQPPHPFVSAAAAFFQRNSGISAAALYYLLPVFLKPEIIVCSVPFLPVKVRSFPSPVYVNLAVPFTALRQSDVTFFNVRFFLAEDRKTHA